MSNTTAVTYSVLYESIYSSGAFEAIWGAGVISWVKKGWFGFVKTSIVMLMLSLLLMCLFMFPDVGLSFDTILP